MANAEPLISISYSSHHAEYVDKYSSTLTPLDRATFDHYLRLRQTAEDQIRNALHWIANDVMSRPHAE
jgi:hypothetical protein